MYRFWEPAKYVAKLRKLKRKVGTTSPSNAAELPRLQLFKCEMGAGHFSQSGRFDKLKEIAIEHAFLLKCLGMSMGKASLNDWVLKPSGKPEK